MTESVDMDGEIQSKAAERGRYLYCLIDTSENPLAASAQLDITGIEDKPISVITADTSSIGAVVHSRDRPYDSTEFTQLRDWLFSHQQVIEAAGDRFGTPLPVRFDTVLEGGTSGVIAWLDRNTETITEAFDFLAGRWEYRITLCWDSTDFETEQRLSDPKLAEIDQQLNQAGEGTQFLLEKQYDQRLQELVQQRQETLQETLLTNLSEVAVEVSERPLRSEAAASFGIELDSDAVAQVAVLASKDAESPIGAILDEQTDHRGVDIRFTGPWPPYTFAPTIGED